MNQIFENASSLESRIKWHGNHNENEVTRIIKAGRLSMVYERGNLRHISLGNHEILRMIYISVRAKEWITVNPVITEEEFEIKDDSFRINYISQYKSGDIDFLVRCSIEGNNDDSLVISMEGEALSSFEKNRIGFCILHPIKECSGKPCIIIHSNEISESLIFPKLVSPTRPFTDIRTMQWNVSGNDCSLIFQGDIFETEDQRNWTDASYKTYSTPINIPYPVRILKGDKISQKVELKAGGSSAIISKESDNIEIMVHREIKTEIPKIGICRSSRTEPLSVKEIETLRDINFDHYRIDLHLFGEWKTKADIAVREAASLDYSAEFAIFVDSDFQKQICDFAEWLNHINLRVVAIILFHKDMAVTPLNLIEFAGPVILRTLPGVKIIGGTNANFAQLNKIRPDSPFMDYTCYSIQPQEHAGDNLTLVENMEGQSYTVESARKLPGGKEVWISPVNIQRRFNANAGFFERTAESASFPLQVDSRLMSLFGAGWTVGSLKYIIEKGPKGITYFETVGERGIMQGDSPSRWPENFPAVQGMLFPVWFVFRFLLQYKSLVVTESESSNPLAVNSLVLSDSLSYKMLLANFTSSVQKVKLNIPSQNLTLRSLTEDTFADAAEDVNWLKNSQVTYLKPGTSFILKPYSVSFIE